MRIFGRRQFLKGAAIAGAAGAAGALPALAAADDRDARAERVTFEVAGLDPAHDGLRVVQLSDLHVGTPKAREVVRRAVAEANRFAPDLVVLTGDFLSRRRSDVEDLRAAIGGLAAPTIAVLGNHDWWVDPSGAAAALRAHGYLVLENAWTRVRLRGAPFTVVGVGDAMTRREDVARATRGLRSGPAPLVLAHGPKTADRLRGLDRPLLCLSGHTHGGQIQLPLVTRALLAGMREPYVRGRYEIGEVQLYVNRGLGTSGVAVRVNAPAEVTLATLRVAGPRDAPAGPERA